MAYKENKHYCPLLNAMIDKTDCLEICLVMNEEILAEAVPLTKEIFKIPNYQDICDNCKYNISNACQKKN